MERYRRTVRTNTSNEDKVPFKIRFIRQSMVCAIIVAVVFVISLLKTDTAGLLTERIDDTLSYTVDYKSAVMEIVDKITSLTGGK